jgi:hypothetical protein
MVSRDRPVYQEEHAAQLIMARRLDLHLQAEYICADLSFALRFSLAFARRTIHFREAHYVGEFDFRLPILSTIIGCSKI